MNYPTSFFVVINDQGHIIHSSTNLDNVDLMKRYVDMAQQAGDAWILVEYQFKRTIPSNQARNSKLQ